MFFIQKKMKYAFIGLPCSGKTTLAKDIAKDVNGIFIPEIARLYIDSIDGKPKPDDNLIIARLQSNLEKMLEVDDNINISDVPVYLSCAYDKIYNNGKNYDKIMELSSQHNYDKIFNVVDTLGYQEDGTRYQTQEDLFKLDSIIEQLNKNYDVVDIRGIDHKQRKEQ